MYKIMRYSEEQRRNSKINREELDLYIRRNYVEADMQFAAMSAFAPTSASASKSASAQVSAPAPLSEPEFIPAMSSAAKEKVPGTGYQKSASPQKKPGLLGRLSGKCIVGAGKNAVCDSMPAEDPNVEAAENSVPLYAKESASMREEKRRTEPAKKRAGSAKIKSDVYPEDVLEEEIYEDSCEEDRDSYDYDEDLYRKLAERVSHVEDSFSDYLLFLIGSKGLSNADVYKRALVDKKVFSKIKNNPDYHPQKLTAMCLCIGAMLNLDESRDLLARAGYALSPSDKTDIIFSYFIENKIYDMIELDIQLEEHGLECIIA